MRRMWPVLALCASSAQSCATRTVPASYPRTSAASPEAPLGRPLRVTTSLDDSAPLPCRRCAENAAAHPEAEPSSTDAHAGHHDAHR